MASAFLRNCRAASSSAWRWRARWCSTRAGADGRAAGRAGQEPAPPHAVRDQAPAARAGRDHGLRHPRPKRGAVHVRQGRRVQFRPAAAGRRTGRPLQRPVLAFRGHLHRRDQFPRRPHPRRRGRRGHGAACGRPGAQGQGPLQHGAGRGRRADGAAGGAAHSAVIRGRTGRRRELPEGGHKGGGVHGDHQRVRLLAGAQCLVCKLPAGQAGGAALAGAAGLGFDTGSAFVFSSAAREAQ